MAVNKHIIDVKTRGAEKSKKQIKGVGGALGGLAKQAGIAAAAYFGTRALLNGIKASVDLFGRQQLAEKKLEAALGKTSKALLNQAKALQQVTMFGDETIIEAQAMIAAFTDDEETIKKATQATLDLAAAKGFDLVAAADLVSKSLGSTTNALTRYGVVVTGAVGSSERLETLTTNVGNLFGGQATQQADTMSGSLAQMSNAIGDAGEALGETLAPMIIASAKAIKSLAEGFQSLWTWQDKYTALAQKTKGLISEEDAAFLMMQQNIENTAKRTEVLSNIQETFNQINTNTNKTIGESTDLQNQFTDAQIATFIASGQMAETITLLRDEGNELAETLQRLVDQYNILPETTTVVTDSFELYRLEQEKTLALEKQLIENQEKFIKLYPELAKKMGLVSAEEKKRKAIMGDITNAVKGSGKLEQRVSQVNAIINTAEAVTEFISKGSFGRAALAAAMGAAAVSKIESQKFATGADYITSGPEMIMVGDNPSGQERVQVTPLGGDPNINGPQGSGMTINIQGSVIGTEEFTEEVLMPQIEEGLRLGNNI